MSESETTSYGSLRSLLIGRRGVIADRAFYERDPAGHLAALQNVSEAIVSEGAKLEAAGLVRGRLRHYLSQCSYDKALAWIEAGGRE